MPTSVPLVCSYILFSSILCLRISKLSDLHESKAYEMSVCLPYAQASIGKWHIVASSWIHSCITAFHFCGGLLARCIVVGWLNVRIVDNRPSVPSTFLLYINSLVCCIQSNANSSRFNLLDYMQEPCTYFTFILQITMGNSYSLGARYHKHKF